MLWIAMEPSAFRTPHLFLVLLASFFALINTRIRLSSPSGATYSYLYATVVRNNLSYTKSYRKPISPPINRAVFMALTSSVPVVAKVIVKVVQIATAMRMDYKIKLRAAMAAADWP
jgi:hypothetical protein